MVANRTNQALSHTFFEGSTLQIARKLLGMKLCTTRNGALTSGMIVEVEAYRGQGDEASHSHRGPTARNKIMFEAPGHCYVYFIYGMYHCVNIVTEHEGRGAAVLVRALEPIDGVETMQRRRKLRDHKGLTSGPGKLCQALAIDHSHLGEHFAQSNRIWLEPYFTPPRAHVRRSPRIGITKSTHLQWRFFVKDNAWVSR